MTKTRPAHTSHLVLPGDHATFCGKSMRQVDADPHADARAYDPITGPFYVDCIDCMDALDVMRSLG